MYFLREGVAGLMDCTIRVGKHKDDSPDNEQHNEGKNCQSIRVRPFDYPAENVLTNKGSATIRDLVYSKERGFEPGRNHTREQRTRKRLRPTEYKSNDDGHSPCLSCSAQKPIGINHNARPNDQRNDNRV